MFMPDILEATSYETIHLNIAITKLKIAKINTHQIHSLAARPFTSRLVKGRARETTKYSIPLKR